MTNTIHRLALASVAALALTAGAAQAADLRAPAPAPMAEATPVYPTLWSGFYVGAHVGYGWGQADGDYVDPSIPTGGSYSHDVDGMLGGLQIGYNWQYAAWVMGLEGDFSWSGMDGDTSTSFLAIPPSQVSFDTQINWLSTIRARVGWAPDRWMIYATGGIAFADFDVDVNTDGTQASDGTTKLGWTVGAGVEYALTDAWRLGLEYKYLDFGDETYATSFGGSTNIDFDTHAVSLKLNYRF